MIVFKNDGVVPLEAFTTFGLSAKPGSTNPIGKFGTGLKYAVAITLRLGGTFTLWRDREEYVFYTKTIDFRGKEFAVVRMKKRVKGPKGIFSPWSYHKLPFTTELGSHWKPWMAVRELEANCRDENGQSFIFSDDKYPPLRYGGTTIIITCPEMQEAFENIDEIFMPKKELVFETDTVRVYEGESDYVYYRGMRVTDLRKPSLYTYEMKSVMLTEDRTSMYSFLDESNAHKALLGCEDRNVVDHILENFDDHWEEGMDWDDATKPKTSAAWYGGLASWSGGGGRFGTMRENLSTGLAKDKDVAIELEVGDWERILDILQDVGDRAADAIREQLEEEGWIDDDSGQD